MRSSAATININSQAQPPLAGIYKHSNKFGGGLVGVKVPHDDSNQSQWNDIPPWKQRSVCNASK